MRTRRNVLLRAAVALGAATGLLWAGLTGPPLGGAPHADAAPAADRPSAAAPTVKGKVYAGYQGWFAAEGDGSPRNQWVHWASSKPSPGNQTFELYPDVSAYPDNALFQTGYSNLGNGKPAKLFSSYSTAVVDQHFHWMQQYGVDGAALQRFGSDISEPGSARFQWRNDITAKARGAAEKYNRGFYVEYDISGLNDANLVRTLQDDWTNTVKGSLKLTDSPAYAREGGKPVVELWGLGVSGRPGTPQSVLGLINWFKDQGAYVIGGVPRAWRTSPNGYDNAYRALNMLSPWNVGAATVDNKVFADDQAALAANGQAYQPVIYPGFAWSNWNGGARNQIPRRAGDFMWQQAVGVAKSGADSAFIAMFDEYDEGTAIAPAAEDASMIPTDQYFLTLDADGKHMSSDFYLRLAGAAERMITGQTEISETVPIPLEP